jgi:hypothetical protein
MLWLHAWMLLLSADGHEMTHALAVALAPCIDDRGDSRMHFLYQLFGWKSKASCNGGQLLPANACGGMTSAYLSALLHHFPPATMAGELCFRQSLWWVLISASPGGGYLILPLPVAERATCRL